MSIHTCVYMYKRLSSDIYVYAVNALGDCMSEKNMTIVCAVYNVSE